MKWKPGGMILIPLKFGPVFHDFKSIPKSVPGGTSVIINVAPSVNNNSAISGVTFGLSLDVIIVVLFNFGLYRKVGRGIVKTQETIFQLQLN